MSDNNAEIDNLDKSPIGPTPPTTEQLTQKVFTAIANWTQVTMENLSAAGYEKSDIGNKYNERMGYSIEIGGNTGIDRVTFFQGEDNVYEITMTYSEKDHRNTFNLPDANHIYIESDFDIPPHQPETALQNLKGIVCETSIFCMISHEPSFNDIMPTLERFNIHGQGSLIGARIAPQLSSVLQTAANDQLLGATDTPAQDYFHRIHILKPGQDALDVQQQIRGDRDSGLGGQAALRIVHELGSLSTVNVIIPPVGQFLRSH